MDLISRRLPLRAVLAIAGISVGTMVPAAARAAELEIEVLAGEHDRQNVPVTYPIPEAFSGITQFKLTRVDTGEVIDSQFDPHTGHLVWILRDQLAAGKSRSYRLNPVSEDDSKLPQHVTCTVERFSTERVKS